MKADSNDIIQEIGKVLARLKPIIPMSKGGPNHQVASEYASHNIALVSSAIERYTQINSSHRRSLERILEQHSLSEYSGILGVSSAVKGLLQALQSDYQNGYLRSVEKLLNAELFSDFMGMASHLLEENYYIPAAVLIGSVLEENIRKLSIANDLSIEKEDGSALKASTMNDNLKKADVYNGIVQKQVTAWLSIRNSAAHGKYDEFTKEQVLLMHHGVLGFIENNSV